MCLKACSDAFAVVLDFMLQSSVKGKGSRAAFEIGGFQVLVGFKLWVTFAVPDASLSTIMFEVVGVVIEVQRVVDLAMTSIR